MRARILFIALIALTIPMALQKRLFHTRDDGNADDSVLWMNLKAGDERALSTIYTRYFDELYNYSSRITPDVALVQDCIQDIFVEIWNKRETISEVRRIKMYLYTAIRRRIIHQLSLQNRHREQNDVEYFELKLLDNVHFLNQALDQEMNTLIRKIVNELSPKQKEAIFLIYFDELSYDEASSVMGLKTKTVYNLVHLAISKLRERKGLLKGFLSLII